MTKRQRIRAEIKLAISKEPVAGGARTALMLKTRNKYSGGRLSTGDMDSMTIFDSYPQK